MFKKLGFKTLALAAALAVAAPIASMARDRDDYRGRDFDRHERWEHRDRHERYEHRDRDDWRYRDNSRFRFGFGVYGAPAPAANGYYDQYGNWIPNTYYAPAPAPAPYYGPYGR